jgi:hypothetical protein
MLGVFIFRGRFNIRYFHPKRPYKTPQNGQPPFYLVIQPSEAIQVMQQFSHWGNFSKAARFFLV